MLPRVPWLGDERVEYLSLLHPSRARPECVALLERIRRLAPAAEPAAIGSMLAMSWRPALVACAAVCARDDAERFVPLLVALLRDGSWVSPQVAVALGHALRWEVAAIGDLLEVDLLAAKARGALRAIGLAHVEDHPTVGYSEFGMGRGIASQWLIEVAVPARAPGA